MEDSYCKDSANLNHYNTSSATKKAQVLAIFLFRKFFFCNVFYIMPVLEF